MKAKLIALIILVLLFLIFLMQNTEVVTLRLYFWKISMSQIILITRTHNRFCLWRCC